MAFGTAAALYIILTYLASRGLDVLERRYKIAM
jgi:ABC-type amino acid transport system permease subunit